MGVLLTRISAYAAHSRGHTAASSAAGSMVDGGVDAQVGRLFSLAHRDASPASGCDVDALTCVHL